MRTGILRVLLWLPILGAGSIELCAQDPPKPLATGDSVPDKQVLSSTDDRFPQQRAEADRLLAIFNPLRESSMADIDTLMRNKRCQIARIDGLLNRSRDARNAWLEAEKLYWKAWGDAEQSRVTTEQKSLANIEADLAHAADLVDSTKRDREELQTRKAALQQGPQTEAIRAQIDELIIQIQDDEAKLTTAQGVYTDLTEKLKNFETSLTARLIKIRQSQSTLDTYALQEDANYEKIRTSAQEICNSKAPDAKKSSLPKGGPQ